MGCQVNRQAGTANQSERTCNRSGQPVNNQSWTNNRSGKFTTGQPVNEAATGQQPANRQPVSA